MKFDRVVDLTDKEKVLVFDLNWFDLCEKTQQEILAKAKQAIGPDNIFSFPNIHVEFVVTEKKI